MSTSNAALRAADIGVLRSLGAALRGTVTESDPRVERRERERFRAEIQRRPSVFPFELNFKKFQPRFFSAGGEEPMVFQCEPGGLA